MEPVQLSKDARFEFIEAERNRFSIRELCRRLKVSPAGYYAWRGREVSQHALSDKTLSKKILKIFEADDSYGSPRIHRALRRQRVRVGRKRVARLMRECGLRARSARIYRRTVGTRKFFERIPNRILTFRTTAPGQVLLGDVTYVKVGGKQRYVAAVLDRHSRRVLGWAISAHRDVDLTLTALQRALKTARLKPGALFHSDRGAEYCAYVYSEKLEEMGVIQSTNRPGEMNDNSVMESFWHTLKTEMYHGAEFKTDQELVDALQAYFIRYNTQRLHSSLDYMPPMEYEKSIAKAA